MMRALIQTNLIAGYGTILSNFYESIVICERLKPHLKHITLVVNCEPTQYFNIRIFHKIFNLDYLKSYFDEVIVNDKPHVDTQYDEMFHVYTRDDSKPGNKNWDLFLDGEYNEIEYLFNHQEPPHLPNILDLKYNEKPKIIISDGFNIFSQYVIDEYQKIKREDYVTIQWRTKSYMNENVKDKLNPINFYQEEFIKIIKENKLVYVCGNSNQLKDEMKKYPNVFFNEEVLEAEDMFHEIKDDDLLLKQNVLTILDMLTLRDSNHIYHFTWFGKLSLFLILSYVNDTPITMFTFPSDMEIQDRGIFNDNKTN